MKIDKKISGLLILVLITTTLSAQNNNCNIKKTFPVNKGATLRLSNKYGDVNVITDKNDSLFVCATITIVQDNNDLVKKSMKLVTISTNKLKDKVFVSTLYDKKFFSEALRQGRKSFSVDYFIKMPSYMDLTITNEFGNVSVEELSGTLNVRLSQGNLSAKRLTKGNVKPISTIYADHSNVNIDELNWMTLTLQNCPSVNIEKAQALMMTSVISKISMGDISSVVSNSKSDSYNIKSINNIVSESTYSEYEIGRLNGQLKSKVIYGSISISDLNKGFSSIDIVAGQAQVTLKTGHGISFMADIIAADAMVDFTAVKYPGIKKTESNFSTTLLGTAGPDKETKSLIRIRATSGKLTIQ
jgi:hypothetical protein